MRPVILMLACNEAWCCLPRLHRRIVPMLVNDEIVFFVGFGSSVASKHGISHSVVCTVWWCQEYMQAVGGPNVNNMPSPLHLLIARWVNCMVLSPLLYAHSVGCRSSVFMTWFCHQARFPSSSTCRSSPCSMCPCSMPIQLLISVVFVHSCSSLHLWCPVNAQYLHIQSIFTEVESIFCVMKIPFNPLPWHSRSSPRRIDLHIGESIFTAANHVQLACLIGSSAQLPFSSKHIQVVLRISGLG